MSAIAAVALGFAWSSVFSHASYSGQDVRYGIVSLAPLFFGRLLPVAAFVILGTVIAPVPGKPTVIVLGCLGGIFGWPFGPIYEVSRAGPIFYVTEGAGALLGAGAGMLVGFAISRRKKRPNQSPDPTSGLRPAAGPL